MLPIRDTIRSHTFPAVTWIMIGLNTLVFLFELALPSGMTERFLLTFGLIPARLGLDQPLGLLANPLLLIPFFTHMFLHAGWIHFLGNMWTLYIFGDNVEDRMGSLPFLLFYLLGGLIAGTAQVLIDPNSTVPAVGASGAIAAVLGAYFLMFPGARVITLIPIFLLPWFVEIPALFYLGFWFVSQLFSGITSLGVSAQAGGVAFWAHIGGFVFGMLFYRLFTRRHPAYTTTYPDEYYPW